MAYLSRCVLGFLCASLGSSELLAALTATPMADADEDGLTDTEESWWCTDPNNPNSDADAQGFTDGEEVYALLNFTLPRSVRWGYGPPFGPPNAWPDWNGQDGDPNTPPCNDGDYDTIPDFAEIYMVGTRVPEETTDGDKFDDGQELFGITYCPGAPTSCGYGNYPRIEYWNYIKAAMPNWVRPPGDNPFVAAFPIPEISVVPGSWTVERVTVITTQEGQMTETTNSYETSITEGQSTSIADTVTWNEWEEVSQAVERPLVHNTSGGLGSQISLTDYSKLWLGTAEIVLGTGGLIAGGFTCVPSLGLGCVLGVGGGAVMIWEGIENYNEVIDETIDELQIRHNATRYPMCIEPSADRSTRNVTTQCTVPQYMQVGPSEQMLALNTLDSGFDNQASANSRNGISYALDQQESILVRGFQDISYAINQPRYTETRTEGKAWGGAQTTTHEVYEEHTITEGEAFTTGQNWSTAWAVDSNHAADLTFNYIIANEGTEYARELTGLIFNIYLGDDPNPIISYPAWEQFSNGKLENVFPGDSFPFASNPMPLTLEQMERIDLGEPLTVILADYSYGADELFYQDAINGGLTVFIEDGVEDGDELVDSYVIPTWGTETILDVLTRYFPHGEDDDGEINSLWTPEFNGTQPPIWNEYFLSDIAWWNVYLTQPDSNNIPLSEFPAQPGEAVLFRFNRDSDRDGYQDRVEMQYGTDKDDPASHPRPELLAGYVATRNGDEVTVLLKLENSGSFDAYGIDAVMYAPDDTVTIGNNTVGGNGVVRPGADVAVGSLVLAPELENWSNSTAKIYTGGNYQGSQDRVYTFTVGIPGVVGQGSAALDWTDTTGATGTLDLGSNYHAPLPVDLTDGVQLGFDTGTLIGSDSFTVQALTPRDTFTYTIESEPYTPPVIVVSYSDPQGSHRFVTPVALDSLSDDLSPYSGQMLPDARLDIIATDVFTPTGANTTQFVVNSPDPTPIEAGHLYLNFVMSGTLVAELPYTMTFQPGPTVYSVTWSTDVFTETFDPEAETLLVAFWTDFQGNIIDSAARPLDTFVADPLPIGEVSTQIWNFGTLTQGEVSRTEIVVANKGLTNVFAVTSVTGSGLAVSPGNNTKVHLASFEVLSVTLDTATLPTGPYSGSISIRTNDISSPETVINVVGTVESPAQEALSYPLDEYHPWDHIVFITGTHELNDAVVFTPTFPVDVAQMQPLYVLEPDTETLLGIGEYGVDFTGNTASAAIFGNGADGNLEINAGQTYYLDSVKTGLAGVAPAGQNIIPVASALGFSVGDEILVHNGLNKPINEFWGILYIIHDTVPKVER